MAKTISETITILNNEIFQRFRVNQNLVETIRQFENQTKTAARKMYSSLPIGSQLAKNQPLLKCLQSSLYFLIKTITLIFSQHFFIKKAT